MGIIDTIVSLVSGGSSEESAPTSVEDAGANTHPLDYHRSVHEEKRYETEQELKRLQKEREDLKSKLERLQGKYRQETEAGNDEVAQDIIRKAERVKEDLETTRSHIDEIDQRQTFLSNVLTMYDLRESRDDAYWQQLRSLDEATLRRVFSSERADQEDIMNAVSTGIEGTESVVENYRTSATQTQQERDANDIFDTSVGGTESDVQSVSSTSSAGETADPEDVFETDDIEVDMDSETTENIEAARDGQFDTDDENVELS